MNSDSTLNVWHETMLVGKLVQNLSGGIGFQYNKDWINTGFALSQNLPLRTEEYSVAAHRFFANLLPEADARLHIVRDLKISNSDFELLKAIGGECAGAFSILPANMEPNKKARYFKLSDEALNKILARKGQVFNLTKDEERPRLSLAGAQDKCPILYNGKDFYLPQDTAPSTHLLKFEITGYRNIPEYEYFLTKLAKSLGLPVVDIEIRKHNQEHYLLIKRYDRILAADNFVTRLHQEDFCQALGVGCDKKYQQAGGPSFRDCYNLAQEVTTNPINAVDSLLRWQIFNVLAGNSDGHAKNLALIYSNSKIELAPFYDLVCTRALERIDTKLAMSVGGEFKPDSLLAHHWGALAKECNIRPEYLLTLIKSMAADLSEKLNATSTEFESDLDAYPVLQRVKKVVLKQCKKILGKDWNV